MEGGGGRGSEFRFPYMTQFHVRLQLRKNIDGRSHNNKRYEADRTVDNQHDIVNGPSDIYASGHIGHVPGRERDIADKENGTAYEGIELHEFEELLVANSKLQEC
jgi:hypothetical protein